MRVGDVAEHRRSRNGPIGFLGVRLKNLRIDSLESAPLIRIVFGLISSLGILMALGTVLARNLVHAALFLVAFFFIIACQFVLLEAEFMAAMQVLVYIGAVAIILMFGIMLTRNIQGDETTGGHWVRKVPAAVVAVALLAILIAGIVEEKPVAGRDAWSSIQVRPEPISKNGRDPGVDGRSIAIADMSRSVGNEMLQRFMIPFEVAGLLLTAALIGAIALAQSDEKEDYPRLGASVDVRGGTTLDPAAGGGVKTHNNGSIHAAGSLTVLKLSPASDTTQP
ncbi:MAG: NADH:ubiquinone oxidoreductase subunit 6 [Planctomycetota bacterium]|nr:NADH:ubiquinone oxidoreductase subunit 6 [Planctomycetota bacterium]